MQGGGLIFNFPLIVSVVIVLVLIFALAAFRSKSTTWQLTFATCILTILIIFFFGYGTALFNEQRQIVEAKKQEEQERLELERVKRIEETELKERKEKEQDVLSSYLDDKAQKEEKRQKLLKQLGKELAEIEQNLQHELAKTDVEIHLVEAKYRSGEISSYQQLRDKAQLEAKKQELIIEAMNKKLHLLSEADFLKGKPPKDIILAESRRQKAQIDLHTYNDVLAKIEENRDTFSAL